MSSMLGVLSIIVIGLLGASCFATGILFSMNELVITGIVFTGLFIISLGLFIYFFPKKPSTQVQNNPTQRYTTNNMNSMKRNKSDTDLELIGKNGDGESEGV